MKHITKTLHRSRWLAVVVAAASIAPQTQAYLGGFENEDGYSIWIVDPAPDPAYPPSNQMGWDVGVYNAGQYGTNPGGTGPGGGALDIPNGTGLWVETVGGYNQSNPTSSYGIAHPALVPTWNGDPANLSLLGINASGGGGAWAGRYSLDSRDLGGLAVAEVHPSTTVKFFTCPTSLGPSPGQIAQTVSFIDDLLGTSSYAPAFEIGFMYNGIANTMDLKYRQGAGPWTDFSGGTYSVSDQNWTKLELVFDHVNDQVTVTSTPGYSNNPVPSGAPTTFITLPLAVPTDRLSHLGFTVAAEVAKSFYDDFTISIPETSSSALVCGAGLVAFFGLRKRN